MDIDIVVTSGNAVLKLGIGQHLLLIEGMLAHDHTALAHADLNTRGHKVGILEGLEILAKEVDHFKHLLAGNDLCLGNVLGVGGIQLDHAGGVEVKHIFGNTVEDKHVLSGIGDLALCLEFAVKLVDLCLHGLIALGVNVGKAEAQGHRLAKSVALAPHLIGEACQVRKVGVTRGIDEHVCLNIVGTRHVGNGDSVDLIAVSLCAHNGGLIQKLNACLNHHTVKEKLQELLVEVSLIALAEGTHFGKLLNDLGKNTLAEHNFSRMLIVRPRPISHKGIHEIIDGGAAKTVILFNKTNLLTLTGGGNGRTHAGEASTDNYNVISLGFHFSFLSYLSRRLRITFTAVSR